MAESKQFCKENFKKVSRTNASKDCLCWKRFELHLQTVTWFQFTQLSHVIVQNKSQPNKKRQADYWQAVIRKQNPDLLLHVRFPADGPWHKLHRQGKTCASVTNTFVISHYDFCFSEIEPSHNTSSKCVLL